MEVTPVGQPLYVTPYRDVCSNGKGNRKQLLPSQGCGSGASASGESLLPYVPVLQNSHCPSCYNPLSISFRMTQVVPAPAGTAIGANGAENKASGDMITTIPISSARLVKNGEHSGVGKSVMLRVELERSIPAADMPVLEILGDVLGRYGPMLAIQGTGQFAVFSGLWAILWVDAPKNRALPCANVRR